MIPEPVYSERLMTSTFSHNVDKHRNTVSKKAKNTVEQEQYLVDCNRAGENDPCPNSSAIGSCFLYRKKHSHGLG